MNCRHCGNQISRSNDCVHCDHLLDHIDEAWNDEDEVLDDDDK